MCLVPLESASRLQGWPCHRHPDAFADTLRELNPPNLFNPSAWTTRDDEHSLYDFKFFLDEAISGCLSDYLAFGHAGHGTNSYGLSYYLVCGDLALLLQVPWGGAYMDAERATREVNAALDWAGRISARFEAENSRPRGRFILASSGFYGSTVRCQLGDGRPEALDAIERWLHQGFVIHQERPPEVAAGTRIDRVYLNRGAQRMQMAEPIEGARASGEGTGPQQLEHPKVLADAEFEAGSGLDGEESGSSRPGIDRIELAEAIVRLFKGTYEAITVEDGRGSYVQIATFNRSGDAGSVIAFEIVDSGLRTKAHRLSGQYLPSEPYLTRDSETALQRLGFVATHVTPSIAPRLWTMDVELFPDGSVWATELAGIALETLMSVHGAQEMDLKLDVVRNATRVAQLWAEIDAALDEARQVRPVPEGVEAIRFEVTYPWGSSYCQQLRSALQELGLATADDPVNEGSDIDGFIVAATEQALATGTALIEKRMNELDGDEDDWAVDIDAQLAEIGVIRIEQDWKHFEWGGNPVKGLGVEVHAIEDWDNETQSQVFGVWRSSIRPTEQIGRED